MIQPLRVWITLETSCLCRIQHHRLFLWSRTPMFLVLAVPMAICLAELRLQVPKLQIWGSYTLQILWSVSRSKIVTVDPEADQREQGAYQLDSGTSFLSHPFLPLTSSLCRLYLNLNPRPDQHYRYLELFYMYSTPSALHSIDLVLHINTDTDHRMTPMLLYPLISSPMCTTVNRMIHLSLYPRLLSHHHRHPGHGKT